MFFERGATVPRGVQWTLGSNSRARTGPVAAAFLPQRLKAHYSSLVIIAAYSESWPGLSRPSTPYSLRRSKKDVDARDKRGHDGEKAIPSHRNAQ